MSLSALRKVCVREMGREAEQGEVCESVLRPAHYHTDSLLCFCSAAKFQSVSALWWQPCTALTWKSFIFWVPDHKPFFQNISFFPHFCFWNLIKTLKWQVTTDKRYLKFELLVFILKKLLEKCKKLNKRALLVVGPYEFQAPQAQTCWSAIIVISNLSQLFIYISDPPFFAH